jgi:hypothetical protein
MATFASTLGTQNVAEGIYIRVDMPIINDPES